MKTLLLILLLAPTVLAQQDTEWQTGKVLDLNSEKFRIYQASGGVLTSSNQEKFTFAIEGPTHIYIVSHVLRFRWSKEVELTVNGPVKYMIDKNGKFYLIDEKDRKFKLKIEKKILKEP